jgi:hypothetical protein
MMYDNKKTTNMGVAILTSVAVLFIATATGTPSANLTTSGQLLQEQVPGSGQGELLETANVTNASSTTLRGSVLKLSNANVEIDFPLMKGYENGNEIFFIATDASDNQTAVQITVLK